jgi:hypothetical protein
MGRRVRRKEEGPNTEVRASDSFPPKCTCDVYSRIYSTKQQQIINQIDTETEH